MKYMLDAMLYGMAKDLRDNGIDCDTATKLLRGHDDSSVRIPDPEIFDFLKKANGTIALITGDNELAEYCRRSEIPYVTVSDAVIEYIKSRHR